MGFLTFIPILGKILDKGLGIVDKFVEDKDKANELKAAIKDKILVQDHEENLELIKGQVDIILAEAKGSWLQRNWRPGLMALFGIIIFNNYVLNPWLSTLFSVDVVMRIPPDMWALLKLGIGGYIVGRSVEKGMEKWKQK